MLNCSGSRPRFGAWYSTSTRLTWLYSATREPPRSRWDGRTLCDYELGHRRELVAVRPQAFEQRRERGECARARVRVVGLALAVMEEDDRARLDFGEHLRDDLVRLRV